MLSLSIAMQDIRQRLTDSFSQKAIEGAVPAATELQRDQGLVRPYLVYNFADISPTAQRGLGGSRFDTYRQPVNFYSIAADLTTARALSLKVLDTFLGFKPSYAGEMTKRPGGGAFAVRSSNAATEAFIVANSFVFSVEVVDADVVHDLGPTVAVLNNSDGTADITGSGYSDNGDGTGTIA